MATVHTYDHFARGNKQLYLLKIKWLKLKTPEQGVSGTKQ
jgi:hypothetical protein